MVGESYLYALMEAGVALAGFSAITLALEAKGTRLMKLKPGETVVFSYIVFKSRTHRDRVNAKVMKEMAGMDVPMDMPFDMKRMAYGGFKAAVRG
ncbi:MAG TPA: DUF1428 family protein [Woeseiaceae bacterium]|nr:DUF1428 family protein [Woeseiaceae bacterium]